MPRQTNIQIRRGSASDWASVNSTLAAGELAVDDAFKLKVGDGTTAYNDLQYVRFDGGSLDVEGAGAGATTTAAPGTTTVAPTTTTVAPTTTTTSNPTLPETCSSCRTGYSPQPGDFRRSTPFSTYADALQATQQQYNSQWGSVDAYLCSMQYNVDYGDGYYYVFWNACVNDSVFG